ncbi:hypothetical protein ISN44_As01g012670, partial [Arabidopsis suecica]
VMGRVGFNFPIFLTLIHSTVAWILLAFSSLFSLGAVMAFALGLANTSLKHNITFELVLPLASAD